MIATKDDINKIELKLAQMETRLELKLAQMETLIAKTESRLILWAFIFWATQLGAMVGFLKLFIK